MIKTLQIEQKERDKRINIEMNEREEIYNGSQQYQILNNND